jgi:antitoxin MazE
MLTRVQKWGNSQGLRLTKALMSEAGIRVGDQVNLSVQEGRIIVKPVSRVLGESSVRGRYDLETLLAEIPEEYQPEELDWGPPTGNEIW